MVARMENFRQSTGTRNALHLTMIASAGILDNTYSGLIQSRVDLDDLFR